MFARALRYFWVCLAVSLAACQASTPASTENPDAAPSTAVPPTTPILPTPQVPATAATQKASASGAIRGPEAIVPLLTAASADPGLQDFIETSFRTYVFGQCQDRDISGEGATDRVCEPANGLEAAYVEMQADVDSDGDLDLVVAVPYGLTVLMKEAGAYVRVAQVGVGPSRFTADIDVGFADWTGDGLPEIVFDATTTGGGTNLYSAAQQRTILTCHAGGCQPAWDGSLRSFWDDDLSGGFSLSTSTLELVPAAAPEPATLRIVNAGYAVQCCTYGEGIEIEHPITVYTETETLLALSAGGVFEPRSVRVVEPLRFPEPEAIHAAADRRGRQASLEWLEAINNDSCRVLLDGAQLGLAFGCRQALTTLQWQDVNGDGREELIVSAYVPDNLVVRMDWDRGPSESEWTSEFRACVSQRVSVYAVAGETPELLADVSGCVVEPSLFGVRFEDRDGDGQVELVAALGGDDNGDQAGTDIYRWNGETFALQSAP